VCSGEGDGAIDVYATVAGLVEKSILLRDGEEGESRYRMLEVIRQFGNARLDPEETRAWRRRHRDYYLALAERFDAEWTGPDQLAWMTRLGKEHVNLRLAFDFSVADPIEAPLAMRMCAVMEHYFASTGGGAEAVHWLQRALAHGTGTPLERASALRVGCFIAAIIGQLDTAAEMYDAMLPLREEGDDRISAYTLYAGAVLRTWQGDATLGAELALEGTELLAKLRDVGKEANLHFLRGMMLGWADRPDEAASAYQRCLDLTRPRGERWLTSYSLWGLGVDALLAGRLDDSVSLEREALEAKAMFGDQLGIGLTVEALAWAAAERGQGKVAALLLGTAQGIWDTLGTPVAGLPYLLRRREAGIAATRRLLPPAEFDEVHERGRTMPRSDGVDIALGRSRMSQAELERLLTRREREVASLVARGASNRAIADELFISVRTAETHVENILRKLDLEGRSQVADAISALT